MGAMSKKLPLPLGALEVEAKAAEDLGLKDVVTKGEAKVVLSTLARFDTPPSSIQKVIEGTKKWLQHFHAWKANHINRN